MDDPRETNDLATAQAFDEAGDIADAAKITEAMKMRARELVMECVRQSWDWDQTYNWARWENADELASLRSLSPAAQEMDVHLCGAYRAVEDFASRMQETVFGGNDDFLNGEMEDEGDEDKANALVALVKEMILQEARLAEYGLEIFRDAADYGVTYAKFIVDRKVIHAMDHEVKMEEVEGPDGNPVTRYTFSEAKAVELAQDHFKIIPIHPRDVIRPPAAGSVEEAEWFGDWSPVTLSEVRSRIARGIYQGTDAEEAEEWLEQEQEKMPARSGMPAALDANVNEKGMVRGMARQNSPANPDIIEIEWWGNFDIESNGKEVPCVIRMLVKTDRNKPALTLPEECLVVNVSRNPYYHQRKPYGSFTPNKRRNSMDGLSISEVASRHSKFEDAAAALAMAAMTNEVSPPLEVGDRAEISDEEISGPLFGRNLRVRELGNLQFLQTQGRSQQAFAMAEYMERKSAENIGLTEVNAAPRVAAAGIMEATQREDLRLLAYLTSFEDHYLRPCAEMGYACARQYKRKEVVVKTLGTNANGHLIYGPASIRPTDLVTEIRFEPVLTRKLKQKIYEVQFLMNWWDRMFAANMAGEQMGKGPMFDLPFAARRVMATGLGWLDSAKIVMDAQDPAKLKTAEEEYRMFAMGERPGIQDRENSMLHLRAHARQIQRAEAEGWRPENMQALIDHYHDTAERMYAQIERATPDAGQIMEQLLAQMGMGEQPQSSRPGMGQRNKPQGPQAGGQGYASPDSGMKDGPLLRRPMGVTAGASATPSSGRA